MANDPLVDARVIRAVDSSGNVHNLLCDANGNLIATSGGSAAPDQVQLVDGTTPTQKAAVSASGLLSVDTELPAAAAMSDTMANPTAPAVAALLGGYNGSTWQRVYTVNQFPSDQSSLGFTTGIAAQWGYTGGNLWDRQRTPNWIKTVSTAAAGDTALWTPTSGKKFRLMRCIVAITGQATQAVAGTVTVTFRDATTALNVAWEEFIPSVALNAFGGYSSGWINLGNGILSSTANNVLNVNLSAALATGTCRVIACGVEE